MENYTDKLKQLLLEGKEELKDLNLIINIYPDGAMSSYMSPKPEGENTMIRVNYINRKKLLKG